MIATPELVETQSHPAAVIHLKIPRSQMRSDMPKAINEVVAALSHQGIRPSGPLFAHHLTTSDQDFDFEVGFPVAGPVQTTGRVKPVELPGGRIARTVYHGDYQGVFGAWSELRDWMKHEGHSGRGDIWEIYAAGPESSPDPSQWRTQLCVPLASRQR